MNKIVEPVLFSLVLMLGAAVPGAAKAASSLPDPAAKEIAKVVPNLVKQGEAVLRFFGLKVYDIRLWTQGIKHSYSEPFALELQYDIDLNGKDIADRSVVEMRKQGYRDEVKLKHWGEMMTRIFPDIKQGDTLIGLSIPGKEIRFYSRDKLIAVETDTEFSRAFFDIWLSEKTSEPKLRKRLLGLD